MVRNRRIEEIDIIKGIAIILMVAGHAGAPFTKFIYLFHMAVFFIASGFTYKESSSDSIKNVTKTIIKKQTIVGTIFFMHISFYIAP